MSDWIEDNAGKVLFAGSFAIVALLMGFVFLLDAHGCRTYSAVTGVETRYDFGTCYVKQGDRFYPRSELELRNATKGE